MSNGIDLFSEEMILFDYFEEIRSFLNNLQDSYIASDKEEVNKAWKAFSHLVKLCQDDIKKSLKKIPTIEEFQNKDLVEKYLKFFTDICKKELDMSQEDTGCNLKHQGSGMI